MFWPTIRHMWLVFLALHLVGLTGYNLLLRRSLVSNGDPWTLATLMQTGVALPMIPVLFIVPLDFSVYTPSVIAMVVAVIALAILLHLANVKALQYLEAGVYSVLFNFRILCTTILGIVFLGEKILPLQICGGLLIFLAILTIRQKKSRHITRLGIIWGLAAAVIISFLNMFDKRLVSGIGYIQYAVPVMLVAAVIMWAVLLLRKRPIRTAELWQPRMALLMVLRAAAAYGMLFAFYAGSKLSVATYISSLSVITTVALGIFLLKEKDYLLQKLASTALAVLGLTFILVANLHP